MQSWIVRVDGLLTNPPFTPSALILLILLELAFQLFPKKKFAHQLNTVSRIYCDLLFYSILNFPSSSNALPHDFPWRMMFLVCWCSHTADVGKLPQIRLSTPAFSNPSANISAVHVTTHSSRAKFSAFRSWNDGSAFSFWHRVGERWHISSCQSCLSKG